MAEAEMFQMKKTSPSQFTAAEVARTDSLDRGGSAMAKFGAIRVDIGRLLGREDQLAAKIVTLLTHLGLHAVLLYRFSRWLHLHRLDLFAIPITYLSSVITGAQISRRATIGKGLEICHPQGVVVGATAVIGDYCTLVQGNVIGQLRGDDDRPFIGDHFYAGAGAKILGRITIGNRISVGANSVVIRSLPDGVSALGVPAKIIFHRPEGLALRNKRPLSPEDVFQRLVSLLKKDGSLAQTHWAIDESTALLGEGIGIDSIDMLRIICAIEEEFRLTFDDQDLAPTHFETIGSLVALILRRAVS
jgi:serine O-acetyltransferase